jgi:hypothetical protein
MALLLMREGSDPDVALSSAARLSDATPKQVAFADDLIKRRKDAYAKLTETYEKWPNVLVARDPFTFRPNWAINQQKQLKQYTARNTKKPGVPRIESSPSISMMGRGAAKGAAEMRLREEIAFAAAEGNVEKMQLLLQDFGYFPDDAYRIALRYINPGA